MTTAIAIIGGHERLDTLSAAEAAEEQKRLAGRLAASLTTPEQWRSMVKALANTRLACLLEQAPGRLVYVFCIPHVHILFWTW